MEWGRFEAAREVLSKYLRKTRLARAASLERNSEQKVFLKLENELPTGSFKVRGAIYALSLHEQRGGTREVVASSTGNHGAAVAYAAKLLGWRARIFLPEKNNPVKRKNIKRLGAAIEEKGTDRSGGGIWSGVSVCGEDRGISSERCHRWGFAGWPGNDCL